MYQTYQLPAGLLSPTFPGMMHCHNSILDFPPCLLFASLKESVHFSINCIESCLMPSTCILRLCVASFPEMQTFIPGKGIRKTTLGVEAKDFANKCCNRRWNKDFKDFSTFAIICSVLLLQAVAQLHKSTQVKQLEYLEIQVDVAIAVTSNYILYIFLSYCRPGCGLPEKTTGKTASMRKQQGRFRAHLLGLRKRNASTGSCDLKTVAQRFDAMSGVYSRSHAFISSNGRAISSNISSGRTGMS